MNVENADSDLTLPRGASDLFRFQQPGATLSVKPGNGLLTVTVQDADGKLCSIPLSPFRYAQVAHGMMAALMHLDEYMLEQP